MQKSAAVPGIAIRWREIFSYGLGSVASNLTWNMVGAYLIVFYTDVALLPVASVATLILVARVFDAIIDPIAGVVVDRTHNRFGKARPYMLFASVPFTILCSLTFFVPNADVQMRLLYAYLTFGLLGAAYSFLYVPYGAMQPLLTTNTRQMLQLSSVRAMGTSIASIFVFALMLPTVAWLGQGNAARGYWRAATLFSLLTMLLFWATFFGCRERVMPASGARQPLTLKRSLSQMVQNPIWWIAVVFELLIFVRLGMLAPAMVFYAKEVLHAPQVASVLLPVMSAAILTGGLLAPLYLSRFGKRKGMYLLLGFTILMFIAMVFAQSRLLLLTLFFLGTAGNGIQAAMVFTMVTEAVELQESRFGGREEGLMSCSTAFTQKVGFALGGALLGYVLAYVGYDPHQPKPGVSVALTALVVGVPIVVAVLQMLCISFYRLDRAPSPAESTRNNWTPGPV